MVYRSILRMRRASATRPVWTALVASMAILLPFFPEFFNMRQFPYIQTTWELHDPAVSQWVMLPSLRAIKYELIHNHNFLWSNLRALGLPLLGNEIQGAPLFPLTLLCIWIPEPYFWNIFILLRLTLATAGSFLLGTQIFRFSKPASTVFSIAFGLSFFAVRWMNHPWQNGFVAGIWYIYFALLALKASSGVFDRTRAKLVCGLALAAYSLVTAGFPEGSAMSGLLAFLVVTPPFVAGVLSKTIKAGRFISDILVANVIGIAAGSAQLFAIIELIGLHPPPYRPGTGTAQFDGIMTLAPLIERIGNDRPGGVTIHYFHLIPMSLCLLGILKTARGKLTSLDVSALACLLFFVLKFFPVWPWFNSFVGSLPVLKENWFIIYFFPIAIWFFAYFAAKGVVSLTDFWQNRTGFFDKTLFVIALLIPPVLFTLAVNTGLPFSHRRLNQQSGLYFFFAVFCLAALMSKRFRFLRKYWAMVTVLAVAISAIGTTPKDYLRYSDSDYEKNYSHTLPEKIRSLLIQKGYSLLDGRERSGSGDYVSAGIASIDDGTPPILPERLSELRSRAFIPVEKAFGPQIIFKDQRVPFGYNMVSTMFYIERTHDDNFKPAGHELAKLGEIGDLGVYFDSKALPRAYTPNRCTPVDKKGARDAVFSHDKYSLGQVYLEDLSSREKSFCDSYAGSFQSAPLLADRGSLVTISPVRGPSILVLNDNFYPGWSAFDRLSGESLSIKAANYAFRAVILPENKAYQIEFLYQPVWLSKVKWLSSLSLGLLALIVIKGLTQKSKGVASG